MTALLIALLILSIGMVGLIHLIRYARRLRTHLAVDLSPLTPQAIPRAVALSLALILPVLLFILAGVFFFRFNPIAPVWAQNLGPGCHQVPDLLYPAFRQLNVGDFSSQPSWHFFLSPAVSTG